ncbi:unnamed protein product, partial [Linum tenue]
SLTQSSSNLGDSVLPHPTSEFDFVDTVTLLRSPSTQPYSSFEVSSKFIFPESGDTPATFRRSSDEPSNDLQLGFRLHRMVSHLLPSKNQRPESFLSLSFYSLIFPSFS